MTDHHACGRGCTLRNHHTTECTNNDCRGCQPRPAQHGTLCNHCWQRLHHDIIDAPTLTTHLRHIATPTAAQRPLTTDPTHSGDPAEADLLHGAIDAADEIHAQLAHLATEIAEQRGLNGPSQHGWWRTKTTTVKDHETGEHYLRHSQIVGIHTAHTDATHRITRWLLPHLDWLTTQDYAGDVAGELAHLIATTKARWPQAETRTRSIDNIACPRCEQIMLTYTPPQAYRLPFTVACNNPDCGRTFSEDEWSALVFHVTRKAS